MESRLQRTGAGPVSDVEGYAVIPRAIQRDTSISIYAKVVYLALSSRADARGRCYPGMALIAAEASCSERQARRALEELRERGLVSWTQRRKADGGLQSSLYSVHPEAVDPTDYQAPPPPASQAVPPGQAVPTPVPDRPRERTPDERTPDERKNTPGSAVTVATAGSQHAEGLCKLLADLIVANGSKRPTITKQWLDACRLLIDKDGRSPKQVENMIHWCQEVSTFWPANIMSMPKLRERYDQMRLQAMDGPRQSVVDQGRAVDEELRRQAAAEQEGAAWTPSQLTR